MHLDVLDLRNFYYRTRLGRAAQAAIRDQVVDMWPDATGQTVAGFGFAVPLLRPYLTDARRVIGLMPGEQGVMPWPAGLPNVSVLCEDTLWPIETGHMDRLILMHGLETSENPSAVLNECYRVLGPGGRVLFIVPNRGGMWARRDGTPFGYGRPYTAGQLEAQLKRHHFVPERQRAALFQPPSTRGMWHRFGPIVERIGQKSPATFAGGVIIVEASKRVHAPTRPGLPEAVAKPLRALEGIAAGDAKPA